MKKYILIFVVLLSSVLHAKQSIYDGLYTGIQIGKKSDSLHVTQPLGIENSKITAEGYVGYSIFKNLGLELQVSTNDEADVYLSHTPPQDNTGKVIEGSYLVEETANLLNWGVALAVKPNIDLLQHGAFTHRLTGLAGLEYRLYKYTYRAYNTNYNALGDVTKEGYLSNKITENENLFYYNLGLGYELIVKTKNNKPLAITASYIYSMPSSKEQGNFTFKNENKFLTGVKLYFK